MVTDVKERHERRRSSLRDGKRTHTRVFLVTTDDINDGTGAALEDQRVPGPGDFYRGVRFAGKDAEPVPNSDKHFEVTVEYSAKDADQGDVHPLNRPPEISWGASEGTEPYFMDRSDPPKPTVNTAGDPFEQYMERETGEMVITITLNEATHNPALADTFSHAVNKTDTTIDGTVYVAGTLKLSPIQATRVVERVELPDRAPEDVVFYRKTYTLKARHDGWRDKPLDVGTNELLPDIRDPQRPKRLLPIVDSAGLPVKRPWPLDGDGKRKPNNTDEPAELEFLPYTEKNFSDFRFAQAATWA